MAVLELNNPYRNLDTDVAEVLRRHNVTQFFVEKGSASITINNNPDAVHDLMRIGYSDILYSAHANKHSHILVRNDSTIYVNSYIEAHHYFG